MERATLLILIPPGLKVSKSIEKLAIWIVFSFTTMKYCRYPYSRHFVSLNYQASVLPGKYTCYVVRGLKGEEGSVGSWLCSWTRHFTLTVPGSLASSRSINGYWEM